MLFPRCNRLIPKADRKSIHEYLFRGMDSVPSAALFGSVGGRDWGLIGQGAIIAEGL